MEADLVDVSAGYQYNDLYDICFCSVFLLCHELNLLFIVTFSYSVTSREHI